MTMPLTAVSTTNVFCRPGCPAPAPRPDHVERFATAHDALFAGYRPCLRCRPMEGHGAGVTAAQLRRAEGLRPVLSAARRARARRSGARAVVLRVVRTPLGPMLAGAIDDGICLLEFTDRPMLPTQLAVLRQRLGLDFVAGRHPHLERLEEELTEWFAGARATFEVPIVAPGMPFQERVWAVLRSVPPSATISYEELAERAGRPGAQRAAGTANGANRLAIVVPCHRVIRKTGEVGNYGGGRWRKAWLLRHEAAVAQRRSAFQATSTPTSSYFQATSTDAKPAAFSQAR
jgi:O-6-methylguanine DNA methyltransferase